MGLSAEFWTNVGVVLAATVAALAGYFSRTIFGVSSSSPKADPVLTGIGVELGNRQQIGDLVTAVNRVADAIEGKKQASIEGKIDDILDRIDEAERLQRRR